MYKRQLAGTDNPYALLDTYGRGHTIQVAGAAAYVTKCAPVQATRADFKNCTLEVPVRVDDGLRFADPITWILKEFPTIIPCSPIMPVRWLIMGQWYCSTPSIRTCPPPRRLKSTLGRPDALDFTRGLGKGIFTKVQLAQHAAFWRSTHSRQAVVAKAANAATQQGHNEGRGHLGLLLSTPDTQGLLTQFRFSLFPLLPSLAQAFNIASGIMILGSVILMVVDACLRMTRIYLDRGCGPWLCLGLCNTLYQVFHVPRHIAKAAVDRLKQEFDPMEIPWLLKAKAPPGNTDVEVAAVYAEPRKGLEAMREEGEAMELVVLDEEPRGQRAARKPPSAGLAAMYSDARYEDAP